MIKPLFCKRYISIVIKTNRSAHDSKFHKYSVTSNFDICFKIVLYVTIIN